VMVRPESAASLDIFIASLEGDPDHPRLVIGEPFLKTSFYVDQPAFSSDGRWIAYVSNESQTIEVYVRPVAGSGGRWRVSNGGGNMPVWNRNGRELIFRGPDARLMVADYSIQGETFNPAKPRVWSEIRLANYGLTPVYDLAPDGKRVIGVLDPNATGKADTHLTFLLNFFDELRRKAPGK
jgi:hypothetical protein